VSAAAALAKETLDSGVPPLWVEGEITGWKRHTSGHCYFTLRDRSAQLRAVMFRLEAQRLPADPEEGMEVRAFGTLTIFERRGEFQFVVRELEASGAGGLWRVAFERLFRRLEAEGLLADARKRPLPRFPQAVGVVTSPVGAALQDILRVIAARAPWTRVVLSPARVQGEGAAAEIAGALGLFARKRLADVIIVGRGGGSAEDLWAFNEEPVVRAIAACPVPVISAVGHEIDLTLSDLVADWRAPTPSAAAEKAVPDRDAVARHAEGLRQRLVLSLRRSVEARRHVAARAGDRLRAGAERLLARRRERAGRIAEKLDALSPLAALRRGFAVPLDAQGRVLRTLADFRPQARFDLRVHDGAVPCRVEPEGGGP
jgi:exodeoxyribonuclease VII large subunit